MMKKIFTAKAVRNIIFPTLGYLCVFGQKNSENDECVLGMLGEFEKSHGISD